MGQQNTGEKTEKATAKKLRDARREGQVPKSKDMTHTAVTLAWIVVLATLGTWFADRIGNLTNVVLDAVETPTPTQLMGPAMAAVGTLFWLTVLPLCLVAAVGVLVEFLQAGPVLAPKRIVPKPENVGLSQGFKRIFSIDNVFETAKSIVKTALIVGIVVALSLAGLDAMLQLPHADALTYLQATNRSLLMLFVYVAGLFTFVSLVDWLYQRQSFERKQRMSKHDVKRENKEQDGDPQTRGARRSLHREWATQSAPQAARAATAVVVNPTHVAVAILYQPEVCGVPRVTATGMGPEARLIRESAAAVDVPIVRNVELARALHGQCEPDDYVPEALFDAVAEVIGWALQVRELAMRSEPKP